MKTKAKRTDDATQWAEYRKMRNKINRLKLKLKARSVQDQLTTSDNRPSAAWNIFNKETGRRKGQSKVNSISHNGNTVTDKKTIANILCSSFVERGKDSLILKQTHQGLMRLLGK